MARTIRSSIHVVVDIIVTGGTITYTELQVVEDILQTFHEWFLRNTPCCRCRWEVAPLVTLGKLRRAVTTKSSVDKITVQIVVRYTGEPRYTATTCLA